MDIGEKFAENLVPLCLCIVIFLAVIAGHIGHTVHFFILESGLTILIGIALGFIEYLSSGQLFPSSEQFATTFLNQILLPLIIFESGFSLKKTGLKRNLLSILSFAVCGTLVSALTFSLLIWLVTNYVLVDINLSAVESLVFGSLISATDTVATLAILTEAFRIRPKVAPPLLYDLIFGESVLNDAVAIILFVTFSNFVDHPNLSALAGLEVIGTFIYICFGSVAVGAVFAFGSALLFKHTKIRELSNYDVSLLYVFALCSYYLSDALNMSGIFAIFTCGILMGHYTWHNLMIYTQVTASQIFKSLASIAETIIFAFVGRSVFSIWSSAVWDMRFIGFVMLCAIAARAAAVFPIANFLNFGRSEKIQPKMQVAMWFAALRGGIAFALSLKTTEFDLPHAHLFISTTLFVAIFTTLVFGSATAPFFRLLKVIPPKGSHPITPRQPHGAKVQSRQTFMIYKVPGSKDHHKLQNPSTSGTTSNITGAPINFSIEPLAPGASIGKKIQYFFKVLDVRYLKPVFRMSSPSFSNASAAPAGDVYADYVSTFAKSMRQTPRVWTDTHQSAGFMTPRDRARAEGKLIKDETEEISEENEGEEMESDSEIEDFEDHQDETSRSRLEDVEIVDQDLESQQQTEDPNAPIFSPSKKVNFGTF